MSFQNVFSSWYGEIKASDEVVLNIHFSISISLCVSHSVWGLVNSHNPRPDEPSHIWHYKLIKTPKTPPATPSQWASPPPAPRLSLLAIIKLTATMCQLSVCVCVCVCVCVFCDIFMNKTVSRSKLYLTKTVTTQNYSFSITIYMLDFRMIIKSLKTMK